MAISKITLNGVTQIDLTSDTVTASKLFDDYTAHGADGTVVTGSYVAPTARTASDVSVSGATVTIPAGAYASQVQKSVASGTAGTPTATKGTVNNHSISVTPSVTNTTGYITGSTKTGTAVTVTASELASGNKAITQNGENIDVVGYSTVSVDVQSGGGSDYTYIGSTEFTVNTSSTTAIDVGTFQTGDTSIFTSAKMVFVKIRDKAGRRDGYYYGSDAMIYNTGPGNGATWTATSAICGLYYRQQSGNLYIPFCYYKSTNVASIEGYGIYPTYLYDTGDIIFKARYSSSTFTTGTINGTFVVEVYTLKYPNDITPFDDDYS